MNNHPEHKIENPYNRGKDQLYRNAALRLIKKIPGMYGEPGISLNADFPCRTDQMYETDGEYVIYVEHMIQKDACLISAQIRCPEACEITKIVYEGKYLSFSNTDGVLSFTFEISGYTGKTRTLYAHTLIREKGLTVRVEENDRGRCAGKYSKENYPEKAVAASQHYMFAMREIVRDLGIPEYLNENKLGYILILGFETCSMIHEDYPPHWHLIYRWSYFCGSQAPHIYLDNEGRMTENILYIDGIEGVSRIFQPGEWCMFVDMYGNDVMAFCITQKGELLAAKPGSEVYRMGCYDPDTGVKVWKGEILYGTLKLSNDTENGKIRMNWRGMEHSISRGYEEEIDYDPLLGDVVSIRRKNEIDGDN